MMEKVPRGQSRRCKAYSGLALRVSHILSLHYILLVQKVIRPAHIQMMGASILLLDRKSGKSHCKGKWTYRDDSCEKPLLQQSIIHTRMNNQKLIKGSEFSDYYIMHIIINICLHVRIFPTMICCLYSIRKKLMCK